MLALFSTAFILFGAPAILLYAGRLIQSATDPSSRAVARQGAMPTGREWFCRPPQPLFGRGAVQPTDHGFDAVPHEPVAVVDTAWFYRPMPPVLVWPDLRRLFRLRRRAAGA